MANVFVREGNLLEQDTEAIVNTWNRNIIPWWLLIPHGVSGQIKRKAGLRPFMELGKLGPLALGSAVHTSAGRLPYKAIIHVVGINMLWTATENSISDSIENGIRLAEKLGLKSLAFPIIGAGAGGMNPQKAEAIMMQKFASINTDLTIVLVKFKR